MGYFSGSMSISLAHNARKKANYKRSNMSNSPKETPEESGERIAFNFLREYIPGTTTEYDYLRKSTNTAPAMSFEHFQMEMLIFGLHCLDRATFAHYGPGYRDAIMNGAFQIARVMLAEGLPEKLQIGFLARLDRLYDLRQQEYGAWKLTTGENPKGTLFWEFAKRICLDAEVYNPAAVAVLSETASGIFTMMNDVVEKTLL